ncbi:MAG TPA: histidine phosphatase family protein [Candidatus Limnocylindria bacterium]|jgi:2,3-bisphosphoglycerate-dependent phosphoglycerate mutase|nr:histidine phosphatase family protein [Candidatus Limnocylindria bacterium]
MEGTPRLGKLDVLLVRHAPPVDVGSPGYEERDDERPLTDEGRRAAEELADELEPYVITSVYSSPYARAVETVTPTARRRDLEVHILPDLRERRLTLAPTVDWQEHLRRAWADPDYAVDGAETGRQAQRRAMSLLDLLRTRHADGGRLLVGSHGNLISLVLQAFEPAVDFDFHWAMPMPAIYHLQHDGIGWRVMGGHGFIEAQPLN